MDHRARNIGGPWPGEITVQVEPKPLESLEQRTPRVWLLGLFAFLLLAFTGYGMWTSDSGILDDVFELVRSGLFAALGWAYRDQQTSG